MISSKHLPIQKILLRYWFVAMGIAVLLTLVSITAISYTEYSTKVQAQRESFIEKSDKGFRRLEADLAVNNQAAIDLIIADLKKQFLFDFKIQESGSLPEVCHQTNALCLKESGDEIQAYRVINTQNSSYLLSSEIEKPLFLRSFSLGALSWLGLVIIALSGIGIIFQRFAIRKYVLDPIRKLAEHAIKSEEIPAHYPEEIVQLAAELEESIKSRDKIVFGQLAGGVIHDLRTHIYSIETALKLLSEVSKDNPSYQKRIELLLQASSRNIPKMKSIIETTLDGSREITLQKSDFDLKQTIKSAVETNSDLATSRRVKIALDFPEEIKARHDRVQMERVFSNLVKNAIEAFDANETQPIRAVKLSAKDHKDSVEVTVEDSGPGISLTKKEIFQLSKTTKPHGSGLGLLISKKIVNGHKGEISYGRSDELHGAKIKVRIPKDLGGEL